MACDFSFEVCGHHKAQGLSRALASEGRYELVWTDCSYESYHGIKNFSLFKLGFHLSHRLKATMPFTGLGRVNGAKVMPDGYVLIVLRAMMGVGRKKKALLSKRF